MVGGTPAVCSPTPADTTRRHAGRRTSKTTETGRPGRRPQMIQHQERPQKTRVGWEKEGLEEGRGRGEGTR